MDRRRTGFTLIEVIIVIVIGAILMGMAVQAFGSTANRTAARQARNVFSGMVARTRAQAIESGQTARLHVFAPGDSVLIVANGRVAEKVQFGGEMNVDIQAASDVTTLCMNPRGYAQQTCTSFNTTVTLSFVQGDQSRSLEILPLGQVRW